MPACPSLPFPPSPRARLLSFPRSRGERPTLSWGHIQRFPAGCAQPPPDPFLTSVSCCSKAADPGKGQGGYKGLRNLAQTYPGAPTPRLLPSPRFLFFLLVPYSLPCPPDPRRKLPREWREGLPVVSQPLRAFCTVAALKVLQIRSTRTCGGGETYLVLWPRSGATHDFWEGTLSS